MAMKWATLLRRWLRLKRDDRRHEVAGPYSKCGKGATMFPIPRHISEDNLKAFGDEQKLIEHDAHELLLGPCREVLCNDTMLIWDCLTKGVMSQTEIINYPQPEQWTAKQCEEWCNNSGIDFRTDCKEYDHCELMLCLNDVIQYGDSEIGDDILRRILLLRLDDTSGYGLKLWRGIVESHTPEIYEWWAIEESLADDLVEMGSLILKNKYGCWWGRQSTGMEILMDGTLQAVARRRRCGLSGGNGGKILKRR